uniref:CCHC-type domain-containing protein n=1 Tax=Magallana gigas TaxID=29159 RepID=A0A8W8KRJ9_MAGGI
MDITRFFLVSFHWLVGVPMVILIDPCNDSFLSSNRKGSLLSEYIHTTAATCDMFWPNETWNFRNTFVGLNTTQSCPAMKHCRTLPDSNDIVPKLFCETEAIGCCESNVTISIRKCSLLRVYFHRNSTGCDKAFCFVIRAQDLALFTRFAMSDSESVLLGGDTDKNSSTPAADISDTFNLFKCYLDSSLNSFKKELFDNQEADNSPAGWATVHQYEHNDIASDSDDDKKLRQAENRALRAIKEKKRFQPYKPRPSGYSAPQPATGSIPSAAAGSQQQLFRGFGKRREPSSYDICFHCKSVGHWRKHCPLFSAANQSSGSGSVNSLEKAGFLRDVYKIQIVNRYGTGSSSLPDIRISWRYHFVKNLNLCKRLSETDILPVVITKSKSSWILKIDKPKELNGSKCEKYMKACINICWELVNGQTPAEFVWRVSGHEESFKCLTTSCIKQDNCKRRVCRPAVYRESKMISKGKYTCILCTPGNYNSSKQNESTQSEKEQNRKSASMNTTAGSDAGKKRKSTSSTAAAATGPDRKSLNF